MCTSTSSTFETWKVTQWWSISYWVEQYITRYHFVHGLKRISHVIYYLTSDQVILSPQCCVYAEHTHGKSFDLLANWEINILVPWSHLTSKAPPGIQIPCTSSARTRNSCIAWLHQYMAFVQRARLREYTNTRAASAMYWCNHATSDLYPSCTNFWVVVKLQLAVLLPRWPM